MSGLNTMAAFALSVNRNKLFLECNAWHDLHSRVPLRTPPPRTDAVTETSLAH
jgi:hypothetical protein